MNTKQIHILGMRVDMVQIPEVLELMEQWIEERNRGKYIVISNANDTVVSNRCERVKEAVNSSSLSVPDGISLVLVSRLYGYKNVKRRVYGPELMEEFCKIAQDKGYINYFYGGAEGVPEKLNKKFIERFPFLKVSGWYSPPFRELIEIEDEQIIDEINKANPDVLWVGLGCPKQQLWMYEHKDKLNVPVMVGVGAAFDFHAGTKKQAPRWMREHGMEWFFRLITEPRRLWRRYVVDGVIFLYNVLLEIFLNKMEKNNKDEAK